MSCQTPRQDYFENLGNIYDITGTYYRQLSFTEADAWLSDYEYYRDEGYPTAIAQQYAFDHLYAVRTR